MIIVTLTSRELSKCLEGGQKQSGLRGGANTWMEVLSPSAICDITMSWFAQLCVCFRTNFLIYIIYIHILNVLLKCNK